MKQILYCCFCLFFSPSVLAQSGDSIIPLKFPIFQKIAKVEPKIELQITFNGIFMGECGSSNDCQHERVAGLVLGEIKDTNGSSVSNTSGTTTYWSSAEHSLVCSNYPQEPATVSNGDQMPDYSRIASNIGTVFTYTLNAQMLENRQYEFVIAFNLGNPHQDNPFASVGYHWLKHGDDRVSETVNLKDYYNKKTLLIGPYQTDSNRCHEYFLQFELVGQ